MFKKKKKKGQIQKDFLLPAYYNQQYVIHQYSVEDFSFLSSLFRDRRNCHGAISGYLAYNGWRGQY